MYIWTNRLHTELHLNLKFSSFRFLANTLIVRQCLTLCGVTLCRCVYGRFMVEMLSTIRIIVTKKNTYYNENVLTTLWFQTTFLSNRYTVIYCRQKAHLFIFIFIIVTGKTIDSKLVNQTFSGWKYIHGKEHISVYSTFYWSSVSTFIKSAK